MPMRNSFAIKFIFVYNSYTDNEIDMQAMKVLTEADNLQLIPKIIHRHSTGKWWISLKTSSLALVFYLSLLSEFVLFKWLQYVLKTQFHESFVFRNNYNSYKPNTK